MKKMTTWIPLSICLFLATFSQAQTYCTAKGTFPWEQWNTVVAVANRLGSLSYPTTGKDGYGNFTAAAPAKIILGDANDMLISPKSSWGNDPRNANMFWRVWIDFNGDGDFTDNGEQVISRQIVIFLGTFLDNEQAFTAPATGRLGNTRMRVAMKVGAYPEPCETFERGEVEDYTVQIVNGNTSISRDTLRIVNVTGDTSVRQGGTIQLNVTIRNTGSGASDPNTPLSIYQQQQPFAFKGPQPFCFQIVSNRVPIGRSLQTNETVTLSYTFTLANDFTNLSPLVIPSVDFGQTNVTIGQRDNGYCRSTFIGGFVADTLFYPHKINAVLDKSDIVAEITATDMTYGTDGIFNFTVKISNRGSVKVKNIATNITASPTSQNQISIIPQRGTVTSTFFFGTYYNIWNVQELAIGESLTAQVRVTDSLVAANVSSIIANVYTFSNQIEDLNTVNNRVEKTFTRRATNTPDISLSIAATPSVFTKYTPLNAVISAKNVGNQAFTNVKIEFKYPVGTVNGGIASPTIGIWEEWCAGGIQCFTWTIPTLAANTTASLVVPLFVLNPTQPIVASTQLLRSTPIDNILANNTATVSIFSAISPTLLVKIKPTQLIPVVIQSIAPTITEDAITVELESLVAKEIPFTIVNATGQQVQMENRVIQKGNNQVVFDVSLLPQGLYLIVPKSAHLGKDVPSKFIKL